MTQVRTWDRMWHRSTRFVVAHVALLTGVGVDAIRSAASGRGIRRARTICWLVMVAEGLTIDHIACLCEIADPVTVASAIADSSALDRAQADQALRLLRNTKPRACEQLRKARAA